jgi:hypothetical protein
LICGWRESLVSIGIKAENGDAEAGKVAEAFGDWVFALCRHPSESRKSAQPNVISMTEFAEARRAPRRPEQSMEQFSRMLLETVTAILLITFWLAPIATTAFAGYKYATSDIRSVYQR